jgi:hypothetical protein
MIINKKRESDLATGVVWVPVMTFPETEVREYRHFCNIRLLTTLKTDIFLKTEQKKIYLWIQLLTLQVVFNI